MIVYKRKISDLEFDLVTNDNGELVPKPKSIQFYLTQNIEDLGIYEDDIIKKGTTSVIYVGDIRDINL